MNQVWDVVKWVETNAQEIWYLDRAGEVGRDRCQKDWCLLTFGVKVVGVRGMASGIQIRDNIGTRKLKGRCKQFDGQTVYYEEIRLLWEILKGTQRSGRQLYDMLSLLTLAIAVGIQPWLKQVSKLPFTSSVGILNGINYKDFTIRLADPGVQKDDCFSIPQYTFNEDEYLYTDNIYSPYQFSFDHQLAFLNCANPIQSAIDILDTSSCKSDSTGYYNSTFNVTSPISHDMEGYSYVIYGYFKLQNLPDLCRINLIHPVPRDIDPLINEPNMSYIDIHNILVYGFELQWVSVCCNFGKENPCDYFNETTMGTYCYEFCTGNPFGMVIGDVIAYVYHNLGRPCLEFSFYTSKGFLVFYTSY
ncbi:unnamed protein product [Dovyalis caffra]|uniref:Uncharacterized protein n=1 Tax=Dovyalis caffra TaxID=77055 RepID=A0AAV1SNC1_9ROSI|nr:unnamed protein product [Dovyalis caffra]